MPDPFHIRFNIEVPVDAAQSHFVNRIANRVRKLSLPYDPLDSILNEAEAALGAPHSKFIDPAFAYCHRWFVERWREIVDGDFFRCLRALEGLYKGILNEWVHEIESLNNAIQDTLAESECDVGISWQNGFFTKKGAELLDEKLVNESLRWLADPKYQNVLLPFQKGLSHFLEGTRDPQRFGDAVTDMYEALEAMAKIAIGKPSRDLSALREEFIAKLHLPPSHKEMLKQYIDYGCDFRHALEMSEKRTWPLEHEAESFVYLTGLFIRLAIQSEKVGS